MALDDYGLTPEMLQPLLKRMFGAVPPVQTPQMPILGQQPQQPIRPSPLPTLGRQPQSSATLGRNLAGPGTPPIVQTEQDISSLPTLGRPAMPTRSPTLTEQYQTLRGQEPQRSQFPVKQIPGWRKGLATGLDAIAEAFRPGVGVRNMEEMQAGPQREADEQYNKAEGDWKNKIGELQTEGDFRKEDEALTAKPKSGSPDEQTFNDLLKQINSATNKPYTAQEALEIVKSAGKPEAPKTQTPEQQFISEYLQKNPGSSIASAIAAYSRVTQKPEREPKQLAVGPDGKVIELRPGMTVPAGTKPASKYGQPTADEERRSDLSRNLNENLDQLEEIAKRRPDLFGPVSGRMTQAKGWLGSSDPDVAALSNIKDNIGMVKQSSHGMRSAHHVEEAADSILNGYKNTSTALLSAIESARKSADTFSQDVERKEGYTQNSSRGNQQPAGKNQAPEGTRVRVGNKIQEKRNGKWVDVTP